MTQIWSVPFFRKSFVALLRFYVKSIFVQNKIDVDRKVYICVSVLLQVHSVKIAENFHKSRNLQSCFHEIFSSESKIPYNLASHIINALTLRYINAQCGNFIIFLPKNEIILEINLGHFRIDFEQFFLESVKAMLFIYVKHNLSKSMGHTHHTTNFWIKLSKWHILYVLRFHVKIWLAEWISTIHTNISGKKWKLRNGTFWTPRIFKIDFT